MMRYDMTMRIALMIEGQEDVTWDDWVALGRDLRGDRDRGAVSLRPLPVGLRRARRGALDAWATINALAARTTHAAARHDGLPRLFRHPSVLGKLAATADHVSGGRIELGLGTGWSEVEHAAYGFPFPPWPSG